MEIGFYKIQQKTKEAPPSRDRVEELLRSSVKCFSLFLKDAQFWNSSPILKRNVRIHDLSHSNTSCTFMSFKWKLNAFTFLLPWILAVWQKDGWTVSFSFDWEQMERISIGTNVFLSLISILFSFCNQTSFIHVHKLCGRHVCNLSSISNSDT